MVCPMTPDKLHRVLISQYMTTNSILHTFTYIHIYIYVIMCRSMNDEIHQV